MTRALGRRGKKKLKCEGAGLTQSPDSAMRWLAAHTKRERQMRFRKNPYLPTDYQGRLKTPTDAVLWVHTTDTPAAEFLREGFAFRGDTFYLSSGRNLEFGNNIMFVTYKPTRIFNCEDPRERADLMSCIKARASREELRNDWLSERAEREGVDLGRDDIYGYIDDLLERGGYEVFENVTTLRYCLESLGYTAYFEHEGGGFYGGANIAVFASDFPRITIIGAIDKRVSKSNFRSYTCPRCNRPAEPKELVDSSQQSENGETIQCDCATFIACGGCGQLTHPSNVRELEVEGGMVTVCGDCDACHWCEALVPVKSLKAMPGRYGKDYVCAACVEAGPPEDDDDDE